VSVQILSPSARSTCSDLAQPPFGLCCCRLRLGFLRGAPGRLDGPYIPNEVRMSSLVSVGAVRRRRSWIILQGRGIGREIGRNWCQFRFPAQALSDGAFLIPRLNLASIAVEGAPCQPITPFERHWGTLIPRSQPAVGSLPLRTPSRLAGLQSRPKASTLLLSFRLSSHGRFVSFRQHTAGSAVTSKGRTV